MLFREIIDKFINYLLPIRCLLCNEIIQGSSGLCGNCWKLLEFIITPLCDICGRRLEITGTIEIITCLDCLKINRYYDHHRSLLKFNHASRTLVHHLKYHDKTIIAQLVAKLLYAQYSTMIMSYDLIIPIPMHRLKRLLRFYNQAQLLAEQISYLSNKKVFNDVLIKNELTPSQTTLSKKARLKNVVDSFIIENKEQINNKKVMLIDDVVTTGATVMHCAKLLKEAGAQKVLVLSVALN